MDGETRYGSTRNPRRGMLSLISEWKAERGMGGERGQGGNGDNGIWDCIGKSWLSDVEKSGPDETKKSEDQSDVDESDGDETNDYQGPPISYFEFFNADFDFTFISDVAIISKNIGTVVTTWWVEMTTSSSQFVTETMSYCPEYERLFKKLVGYSGDYTVTENEKQNQQPPQHQWWWSETMSSSLHKSMTSGQSCVLILSKQTISDDAEVSSFIPISSNYICMCECVCACLHVWCHVSNSITIISDCVPQHQWWWKTMSSSLLLSHKSMTSGVLIENIHFSTTEFDW